MGIYKGMKNYYGAVFFAGRGVCCGNSLSPSDRPSVLLSVCHTRGLSKWLNISLIFTSIVASLFKIFFRYLWCWLTNRSYAIKIKVRSRSYS